MNTVSIRDEDPTTLHVRPVQRPSAFGNLIRKECQESRGAAIAGLAVFWLVPALLELLDLVLEGHYGTFPFAWSLLIGAGWMYAIILGAHTVCRDWGKAEEHFLLAQPVSAQAVVGAKLITGAMLVAGVIVLVAAWETLLAYWGGFGAAFRPIQESVSYWHAARVTTIAAISGMAVGYALAFAVAVITRQMLASTVVATLVLLVWAITPLLSSHLTRFSVLLFSPNGPAMIISGSFVFVSVLGLIVGVATSLVCATRERAIRLGHKQLAWMISLVMLALFGVAMTEVGNSLQVRDQAEAFDSESWYWGSTRMIQRGNRFFISYCDCNGHAWSMATFRVADNGRIQDLRRAAVPGMLPSLLLDGSNPDRKQVELRDELTGFAFNENGQLVVTRRRMRLTGTRGCWRWTVANLWRTTLAWPDSGEPEILSRVELALPPGKSLTDTASEYRHDDGLARYAYLEGEGKLYVFDWSEGPHPTPRFEIPLPQDTDYVRVWGGKLNVGVQSGDSKHGIKDVATFDADHPETLLDKQNWSFHVRSTLEHDWPQGFERPGGLLLQVDQHADIAYLSDLLGLRIARQTRTRIWETVGECRTSPLAMLFRLVPQPKAFGDSLLIENGAQGFTAYDVSNPSRPRRVGFFNALASWYGYDDMVLATERHLVLREFNLVTVLDRPDLPGKRIP